MHIEKNVCEAVVGTLLNIEGKSKDTTNARLGLQDMGIHPELHLQPKGGNKHYKPLATYTPCVEERKEFCAFLKSVKLPDGYAANISRSVSVRDGRMYGLKSHDCHVLLQHLLPIGIRRILKNDIFTTLVELCKFFEKLTAKTLHVNNLEQLESDVVLILCKLERIYLPAFFDSMVHLIVHLPREVRLSGLVALRWMYPIERYLGTLKKYVKNKARPEGSIVEGYIVNEALTFSSMYLRGLETRFTRPERNDDGRKMLQSNGFSVFSQQVVQKATHRHIWELVEDDVDTDMQDYDSNNFHHDVHQDASSADIQLVIDLGDLENNHFVRIDVPAEVVDVDKLNDYVDEEEDLEFFVDDDEEEIELMGDESEEELTLHDDSD
ncbi:Uncharacterized protein Adt_39775 [Abeliophyllum distichum]|uniref:DUF4218 domain-containing protein n=1 Tax=Abeliophyllum distichum TaxID=126358 RepID=A0ABD1Q955_9LAMI